MTKQWDELFALAREIEHAIVAGATVDREKAKRLARIVLALGSAVRVETDRQSRRLES
jgi:hypothetical protein